MWDKTHEVGGICEKDYFAYFNGYEKAYAFQISELQVYDTPVSLRELGVSRAPMSYQYVEA